MQNLFSLEKKVALITGASRGIGASIARTLAAHGAHVVLSSRKAEALEEVAADIRSAGGQATVMACHMGQIPAVRELVDRIDKEMGRLDILVANAATNPYFGDLFGVDEGAWDKIMEVNVKGPFFLMQAAAKIMDKNGGGTMVTVASVNGVSPALFQGAYSISKAAVISMTKAFAKELAARNIRVNSLLPGLTDTKFAGALIQNDDIREYAVKQIPMGRYAQPQEMAGAVLYLVSEASSFTTGTTLICDGGQLA
ncbi:SDR family oxidoreductase [Desulfobotulus sp. H1]|uniref:SDR family oxidoreductase n=1 Tax=Desulfobotulus pelophilus TaxID=2823377 RepID=A0ABT3N8A5_9BACT|nr:SDR family oxidoreductase [Desulfobotulus pelophilus]MCW7753687.1 SDR family oxidoreductase [Desulfobotulus pelophilus]